MGKAAGVFFFLNKNQWLVAGKEKAGCEIPMSSHHPVEQRNREKNEKVLTTVAELHFFLCVGGNSEEDLGLSLQWESLLIASLISLHFRFQAKIFNLLNKLKISTWATKQFLKK